MLQTKRQPPVQIPLQIPVEQQPQVENKTQQLSGSKKVRRIATTKDTAFLRRRKVAEIQEQKVRGVYLQPEPEMDLMKFGDYPVISLDDLQDMEDLQGISELENYNIQRLQDPSNDENLTLEFWAMEGVIQNQFQAQLPRTGRNTVPSMSMMYQE